MSEKTARAKRRTRASPLTKGRPLSAHEKKLVVPLLAKRQELGATIAQLSALDAMMEAQITSMLAIVEPQLISGELVFDPQKLALVPTPAEKEAKA